MFFGAVAIAQVPIGDDASVTRVGVTGLVGTGAVGQVTLVTDQNLNQTGLSATGAVGIGGPICRLVGHVALWDLPACGMCRLVRHAAL